MHTEAELAYLAGLIDGEGHIAINLRSGKYRGHQALVKVTNTKRDLLVRIAEQFGATVQKERVRNHWKPTTDIHWAARKAVNLLKVVQPYLVIKQEQCQVVLEFANTIRWPNAKARVITEDEWNRREFLRLQIRQMNKRSGAPEPEFVPYPRASLPNQQCIVCDGAFEGARQRKYCSDACRQKEMTRRFHERNRRPCVRCGKEFAGAPKQQFCSRDCWLAAVSPAKAGVTTT